MYRRVMTVVLLVGLVGPIAGCGRSAAPIRRPLSVSLLFDRFPAPDARPASAFNARAVWPSTSAGLRGTESLQYDELFVDLQGPANFGSIDQTYRRVTVRRQGTVYR